MTNFRNYIEHMLAAGDIYLIFERYKNFSTKSVTRQNYRSKQSASLEYKYTATSKESCLDRY